MFSLLWLLLAAAFLPSASSRVCTPEGSIFDISTQEALDAFTNNCTAANSTVRFGTNYTDSFVLPRITNVTGDIEITASDRLESIEIPDVEYLSGLWVSEALNLARISLPKVRYIKNVYMNTSAADPVLEFPLLELVDSLLLYGNWSSMGFDALHTVNGTLFVCQDDYCDPDEAPERSMNISFPALKQINGRTEFGGNIANLSLPDLVTASSHMNIYHWGPILNPSFPKLDMVENIAFQGNISTIEMPSIQKLDMFQCYTDEPLSLSLPAETAQYIYIDVPSIESLDFPNLANNSAVSVRSDKAYDCEKLHKRIRVGVQRDVIFYCDAPGSSGLRKGAKLGIGLGVGIGGLGLIGLAVAFWISRRAKKREVGMGSEEQKMAAIGARSGSDDSGESGHS